MPMLHFDLDELFEDLIPEEKSKKQNSTDTTHKEKNGGIGGEVPQAQQPQGFTTPPNNSTESTFSNKMVDTIALDNYPHDLTEKREPPLEEENQHQSDKAPGRLWDKLPVREFLPELHNHLCDRSILWLKDEIEAAWKNQRPVLIKIPDDCAIKPTIIEEHTNQCLERYWTASPHLASLMSAELVDGSPPQLLLYRVPQDNFLVDPTVDPPEPTDALSPEDKQFIESVSYFTQHCQPDEVLEIPEDRMLNVVDLANDVDSVVRNRSDEQLRVWKNKNTLVCRVWSGPFLSQWQRESEQ